VKEPTKRRQQRETKKEIWHPAIYDDADIRAIQALALYAKAADDPKYKHLVPGPEDVRRALDWIVHKAAATYENSFVSNDPNGRIAAFMEGRRSVGQQVIKLLTLKPEHFKEHTDGGSLRQDARRKEDDGQG
jgi:hypothetical protein